MLSVDIITLFPELLKGPFEVSIVKRAQNKGHVAINVHNLRDYTYDKHHTVDDYAFGGGAGMVMKIEPLHNCLKALQDKKSYDEVIYLCPDGELLSQSIANELSIKENLILICGHYKGIDERIREHLVTREISIGDYVISGGELAAAVLTDSIVRLIPGVLSNEVSALTDSFQDGMVAPPVYTRPADYNGWKVPDVLLSGDEKKIENWRFEKSLERTKKRRPNF